MDKHLARWIPVAVILLLALLGVIFFWNDIRHYAGLAYDLLTDREKINRFVTGFGVGAPTVFITIQVLQVIFAPIPGEATGFIGGYLFGASKGFLYSTIGLTAGSLINFCLGRLLGRRFIRRWIRQERLEKLDRGVKRQGVLILFVLFIFPGFPKDYLSLFLGITALPFKIFVVIATIGRMPGTLMLSMQGALLFEKMYGLFALVMGGCIGIVALAYRYRERVYAWADDR
jgi:uncharacterized membrane protein YdjX (TVP38/TMEM64 family)